MNFSAPLFVGSVGLHYVLEPALRALVLAGATWLLLVILRVREVSLRLAAWTAILYAALAMPLLSRIVPQVPVPVLSAESAQPIAANGVLAKAAANGPAKQMAVFPAGPAENASFGRANNKLTSIFAKVDASLADSWPAVAIAVYLLVMAFFLSRFLFGLVSGRRLRRTSTPVLDKRLREMLMRESRKAGLKRLPQMAESPVLSVPATLGLLRPVILLPVEWSRWNEAETGAVLAHELSHIARRDSLTQALSRLHRALFWFNPLSWWLDRTLVELAEQASDDAALRSGADRIGYAEVLLHFFRALNSARGRVRWEGVSMAQGSRSARRLERILGSAPISRSAGLAALVALAVAAAPLICLAAAIQPSRISTLPAPVAVAPPPPPLAFTSPVPSSPIVRAPGSSPVAPRVSVEQGQVEIARSNTRGRAERAFAVVDAGAVIASYGSLADLNCAWNLSLHVPGSFFWFRRDGRGYLVRDKAIVRAALAAMASFQTVEQEQAVLNWEESRLDRDQSELGIRRMTAGFPPPDLSPDWDGVEAQVRAIESSSTLDELARAQAQFAQAQWSAMQRSMERAKLIAAENVEAVNREQIALDLEQEVLGRQQARLDRQQAELAQQVFGLTRTLMNRSLQQGLAIPL